MEMQATTNATNRKYLCASETVKLIGTLDGFFPDFGHHQEREMGGLWLHPIKLLDGFWLRFCDHAADNVNTWILADSFKNTPSGNVFHYRSGLGHTRIEITRTQMAPEEANGLLVTYSLRNGDEKPRAVSLEFLVRTDLRPVWFSEEIGIFDGAQDEAEWMEDRGIFLAKDSENEWYAAVGASKKPESVQLGRQFGPERTGGSGVSGSFFYEMELAAQSVTELTFFMAGSFVSREDCLAQYDILTSGADFARTKAMRYEALLNRSRLTVRDKRFEEIFNWVKVNTDWLIVRASGYGRGIAAGMPEYPWWFGCDSFYTLQGVLAMGDFALCRDTLRLILSYSRRVNGNGRIVHEITTNGACSNPGNTQETAHFITMVWKYYQWTGDFALVEEAFDYMQKSVQWLEQQDDDGDLFPSGYGIIEIAGLNSEMIDSAVYTCEAYDDFARMCQHMGMPAQAQKYAELAKKTRQAINTKLWDEKEGLYCDAYTSYPAVLEKLDQILEKTPGPMEDEVRGYMRALLAEKKALGSTESGWLLNRNWVINTPMETGIAPEEKARRALANMHTDTFIGPWGMYLNGMYRNAIMTISTGVMAAAQARYGYADRALELIEKIFSTFGMATPGAISEMSPDYGCFVQAWTTYAVMLPIVRYFFGIQPDAQADRLVLAPCPPTSWTQASIQDVPVLDGAVSVTLHTSENRRTYAVKSTGRAKLFFRVPAGRRMELDGAVYPAQEREQLVRLEKKECLVAIC